MNAFEQKKMILVDSGASRTVFKRGEFDSERTEPQCGALKAITGNECKNYLYKFRNVTN